MTASASSAWVEGPEGSAAAIEEEGEVIYFMRRKYFSVVFTCIAAGLCVHRLLHLDGNRCPETVSEERFCAVWPALVCYELPFVTLVAVVAEAGPDVASGESLRIVMTVASIFIAAFGTLPFLMGELCSHLLLMQLVGILGNYICVVIGLHWVGGLHWQNYELASRHISFDGIVGGFYIVPVIIAMLVVVFQIYHCYDSQKVAIVAACKQPGALIDKLRARDVGSKEVAELEASGSGETFFAAPPFVLKPIVPMMPSSSTARCVFEDQREDDEQDFSLDQEQDTSHALAGEEASCEMQGGVEEDGKGDFWEQLARHEQESGLSTTGKKAPKRLVNEAMALPGRLEDPPALRSAAL
eukprot:TRINITY_DN36993_c0_g1_i3.p1 TRINITY_DN36993_c0_g1~~TRINITY_DN36993_c0_g1_i3.p1  ORF type:complete len:355 (-),score=76.89 TRINITY_DN36993_c0_g1_i3:495-1559(-)